MSKELRVRIWVKEETVLGPKKVLLGTRHITKNAMRAGRVVFFFFVFTFFVFVFFSSWSYLIFEQGGQLGILTSYLGRFLVQCFTKLLLFFCLKKISLHTLLEKFEKLPKTFSYENDERSHAITKTTHLYFTNSLISR